MANKAEERRTAITEFLQTNPGGHTVDQIAAACGFAASDTARALSQLTRNGTIAETEPDAEGAARWTGTSPNDAAEDGDGHTTEGAVPEEAETVTTEDEPEPGPAEDESENAAPEAEAAEADGLDAEPAAAQPGTEPEGTEETEEAAEPDEEEDGDTAEPETGDADPGVELPDSEGASDDAEPEAEEEEEEEEPEPEPVDPDPAVLLVAAQLAVMDGPVALEQVALAAFRIAAPKTVETTLHVLCALAEHGAVECSTPYRPDDRDRDEKAEWRVVVDAAELDQIAAIAQLADAPASVECPTCGSETELPHLKGQGRKPVGPGKKKRTGLAPGELRDMLTLLVKENPGEKMKPNDFVTELRNDERFKHRISPQPSGAVRSALITMEKEGWVTDLGIQPLTYRCHDAK